jgi:hypothetical protein
MAKTTGARPTFQQVYDCLKKHGPARVTSSRGTSYEVHAEWRKNQPVIVGYPRTGEVRIHKDCWGQDITCQGTRAGGIFNGNPSIYDWYKKHCQHAT